MRTVDRRRPLRRRAVGLILAVVALAAATSCGGSEPSISGIERPDPLDVSGVTLPEVTAAGTETPFTFRAEPGQLLVAYFGYTHCPDLCPTTLSDLGLALESMGSDADRVAVAFATVDPARDTPDVIVPYLASFISGGHALRSDDPNVLDAAKEPFGANWAVTTAADGTVEVQHTAVTYVIDPDGRVVDEWTFGTTSDVMASDLGVLLDRLDKETTS